MSSLSAAARVISAAEERTELEGAARSTKTEHHTRLKAQSGMLCQKPPLGQQRRAARRV